MTQLYTLPRSTFPALSCCPWFHRPWGSSLEPTVTEDWYSCDIPFVTQFPESSSYLYDPSRIVLPHFRLCSLFNRLKRKSVDKVMQSTTLLKKYAWWNVNIQSIGLNQWQLSPHDHMHECWKKWPSYDQNPNVKWLFDLQLWPLFSESLGSLPCLSETLLSSGYRSNWILLHLSDFCQPCPAAASVFQPCPAMLSSLAAVINSVF